jgi:hypothetical protein
MYEPANSAADDDAWEHEDGNESGASRCAITCMHELQQPRVLTPSNGQRAPAQPAAKRTLEVADCDQQQAQADSGAGAEMAAAVRMMRAIRSCTHAFPGSADERAVHARVRARLVVGIEALLLLRHLVQLKAGAFRAAMQRPPTLLRLTSVLERAAALAAAPPLVCSSAPGAPWGAAALAPWAVQVAANHDSRGRAATNGGGYTFASVALLEWCAAWWRKQLGSLRARQGRA